jgi:hypothetical protein
LLRIVLAFLSSKHVFCCQQFDVNLLWLALLIYHTQLSRLSLEGLWSVSSDNLLVINKVIDTSPSQKKSKSNWVALENLFLYFNNNKKWDWNLKPIKDDTQKKGRFLNKKRMHIRNKLLFIDEKGTRKKISYLFVHTKK